jgi:hypothetical protein
MNSGGSNLTAFVSDNKTFEDAENFLSEEKGIEIYRKWVVLRAFDLKVSKELAPVWREKLLLSGYFKSVDYS